MTRRWAVTAVALSALAVSAGLTSASAAARPAADLTACRHASGRVALTVITSLDDAWDTSIESRDTAIRARAAADLGWHQACQGIDPAVAQDWLRSAGAMTLPCHTIAERPGQHPPGHIAHEILDELGMSC